MLNSVGVLSPRGRPTLAPLRSARTQSSLIGLAELELSSIESASPVLVQPRSPLPPVSPPTRDSQLPHQPVQASPLSARPIRTRARVAPVVQLEPPARLSSSSALDRDVAPTPSHQQALNQGEFQSSPSRPETHTEAVIRGEERHERHAANEGWGEQQRVATKTPTESEGPRGLDAIHIERLLGDGGETRAPMRQRLRSAHAIASWLADHGVREALSSGGGGRPASEIEDGSEGEEVNSGSEDHRVLGSSAATSASVLTSPRDGHPATLPRKLAAGGGTAELTKALLRLEADAAALGAGGPAELAALHRAARGVVLSCLANLSASAAPDNAGSVARASPHAVSRLVTAALLDTAGNDADADAASRHAARHARSCALAAAFNLSGEHQFARMMGASDQADQLRISLQQIAAAGHSSSRGTRGVGQTIAMGGQCQAMASAVLSNMRKAEATAARTLSPRLAMSWSRGRAPPRRSAWALLSRKSGARLQGYTQHAQRAPRYVDETPNMSDGEETDDESLAP